MSVRRATAALLALSALVLAACQLPPATTTTLSVSSTTVNQGQPVTLSAQVSSVGGIAVGTVSFLDGRTVLGSVPTVTGAAQLVVSTLTPGSHQIAATFSGTGWGPSASESRTVTVVATRHHLALGDSLAVGASAPSGQGYVPRVTAHALARVPSLTLTNLSCGGATTTSMLNGGGCTYLQGSQLAAAEAFLATNAGRVSFITIDIGANDITGCVSAAGVDQTCAATRLATVSTNLGRILARLSAAAPGVPILGMTYYNPYLAYWVVGNQAAAIQTEQALVSFNAVLTAAYQAAGAPVAAVDVAFDSSNFALTGTYNGVTVPQNVALICAWTRMCSNADIHANATGHQVIADQFADLLDALPLS